MAVIKCKMCGGDLNIAEGSPVAECEYCGSKQTVPSQDNEKKLTLFARADRLRRSCEFDKAAGVYESIVAEFPEEAEAYWGLVLCRYGIEYVDDPATGKKIPTCHRSSFDSILEDSDFDQACENADAVARKLYREEAKAIEDIRKGILEVSGKEEPYDIFICYKETDENGERTIDSVIAQDVYDALTEKGYRVFFSRISLEDKLGTEYEPYIFAALNSAKVMLAFGTDYEYFNAVWVKNEWSRFLQLMATGQKKALIPCYKGIDAYDMPKEFAKLQAQDMGKVGAIQDLLRGIDKILGKGAQAASEKAPEVAVQQSGGPTVESLLKRGYMALEDSNWAKASELFDQVLSIDPENGEAYLGLAMSNHQNATRHDCERAILSGLYRGDKECLRAQQFAQGDLKSWLDKLMEEQQARENAEKAREAFCARMKPLWEDFRRTDWLCAGSSCTVGLRWDGTVVAAGDNEHGRCDVSDWSDIVGISAGCDYIAAVKCGGTVVAVGDNENGQCDVSDWRDILAVAAGCDHTVGLKTDGTVVVAARSNGYGQCDVSDWSDIADIAAGCDHTVGLRTDGAVVATGSNEHGQCDISGWCDIVAITAGDDHTVGLKADGTVVAVGLDRDGQCNVSGWADIVAIAAGSSHTVGLKADGTVVAVGKNESGQCEVSGWRNIVAIAVGDDHTVGLRVDGTVVATGENGDGQCEVKDWKLFDGLDAPEQEKKRVEAENRRIAEYVEKKRRVELEKEKTVLQAELSGVRGLFSGLRRREIETRLAEIEMELRNSERS